jgi:rubrerythrin
MATEEMKKIVERAIRMEENSFQLYRSASQRVKDPGARTTLGELAEEEKKHREKLEGMLRGGMEWAVSVGRRTPIRDLKIGDVLEARPLTPEASLQDVLSFAIKREAAANGFYAQMASLLDTGPEKELFEMLARQEAGHKETLERLFEEDIYQAF